MPETNQLMEGGKQDDDEHKRDVIKVSPTKGSHLVTSPLSDKSPEHGRNKIISYSVSSSVSSGNVEPELCNNNSNSESDFLLGEPHLIQNPSPPLPARPRLGSGPRRRDSMGSRRRLDSSGSAYSVGSTGISNNIGSSNIHPYGGAAFYDSDTSNGSLVFQSNRKGTPLHVHVRQQSEGDSSVLSTFSTEEQHHQPRVEEKPSPYLPYNERKLLRFNGGVRLSELKETGEGGDNAIPTNNNAHQSQQHRNRAPSPQVKNPQQQHPNQCNLSNNNSSNPYQSQQQRYRPPSQQYKHAQQQTSFPSKRMSTTHQQSTSRTMNNPYANTRPPTTRTDGNGNFNQLPPSGSYGNRMRAGSTDSYDNGRNSRLSRPPKLESRAWSTGSTLSTLTSGGPPNHAQSRQRLSSQDSRGSISSRDSLGGNSAVLASLSDKLGKDIMQFFRGESKGNEQQQHKRENSNDTGSGFFSGLFTSPSKDDDSLVVSDTNTLGNTKHHRRFSSIEDETKDYHQRNQEFLNKAKMKQAMQHHQNNNKFHSNTLRAHSPTRYGNRYQSSSPTSGQIKSHRKLMSIDNDDWEDSNEKSLNFDLSHEEESPNLQGQKFAYFQDGYNNKSVNRENMNDLNVSSDDGGSSSSTTSSDLYFEAPREDKALLPPPGINTYETYGRSQPDHEGRSRKTAKKEREMQKRRKRRKEIKRLQALEQQFKEKKQRRKKGKSQQHRDAISGRQQTPDSSDFDSVSSTSDSSELPLSSSTRKRMDRKAAKMLWKEREKLIADWKAEYKRELDAMRAVEEENRWDNRFRRFMSHQRNFFFEKLGKFLSKAETFISNLPQTIGAVALAIVTLGVVWFKFAEENMDSCVPVHYRSHHCTFYEFPGCFECETSTKWYNFAVNFHYCCSVVAGTVALSFVLKIIVAPTVVIDEMSSPTTSSPAGLLCMTVVTVFAGRGFIGECLVVTAACAHFLIACWFLYMTLAYRTMPEPSWWPNTVGIGISAVKLWLYYPAPSIFLMIISLSLNLLLFPVSVYRVACNRKISAPVGWIQVSAPSVALYALTIMAQPDGEKYDTDTFEKLHRMLYLPAMDFLFFLSVVGFASSVQSLIVRWKNFSKKEFSPAHAAFCFPTLAHANSIQAYRGALDSFSDIEPRTWGKYLIFVYWFTVLVFGTIVTFIITAKFFYNLPSWVHVDVADEEEPPAPNETMVSYVLGAGETLRQSFVSPVILQANETGMLVKRRSGTNDGRGEFVRTRRVTALGFEPTMNWSEMNEEREVLLDYVAKNPPRKRRHTLSVPGMDFDKIHYGDDFGRGNSGVYDPEAGQGSQPFPAPRARANTTGVDPGRSRYGAF